MVEEGEGNEYSNYYLVMQLERYGKGLDRLALCCFSGLLFMLFMLAVLVMTLIKVFYFDIRGLILISCLALMVNLAVLFMFERKLKKGDSLFNELSDEFEWRITSNHAYYSSTEKGRPEFSVRFALRNFVKSSDLPLLPGKAGMTLYLLLNIGIWVVIMLFGSTAVRI